MMDLSQGLLLNNLILEGHRKNYQVSFQPGVNIIYGDADTGKSSILRLIHYLLGGKQIELDEEIATSVKHAILEVYIHGKPYCICRDIFNSSRDIDVYSCEYSEISSSFPEPYKSSVTKGDDKNKSLSDFLLETLEFPTLSIKQAPTKDFSESARLSFLDLFKFMYLDQDDVGSASMLNIGNFVLETKNREVLKYIFNVLDTNISELEEDISRKTREKSKLKNEYEAITTFLSQTGFESLQELDQEVTNVDEVKAEFRNRLSELNSRMTGDSELYEGLKEALDTINLGIEEQEDTKNSSLRNIERFTRLLNDYQNDLDKIKASLLSRQIIGTDIQEKTSCPVCETPIEVGDLTEMFDIPDDTRLRSELTSISRRERDLKQLISDNRLELSKANSYLEELYTERSQARQIIDEELEKSISPYLAERDSIVMELAKLEERREKLVHSLKVRNKQRGLSEQIGRLESAIEKLKLNLDEIKRDSPSLEGVLDALSASLNSFIEQIKIKNRFGISIDEKSFLPRVRDIEYRKINSGGLRTIVSIGYLTSILMQKLIRDTNIPGLLMIDTVGKFLGKTPESADDPQFDADDIDGVADPEKYKNLFDALINVASIFDEQNKLCQIILVDNDIPPDVAFDNEGFEIAHYRSNGMNGLPVGLIDDWDSASRG